VVEVGAGGGGGSRWWRCEQVVEVGAGGGGGCRWWRWEQVAEDKPEYEASWGSERPLMKETRE
jgi:hypothetical protein